MTAVIRTALGFLVVSGLLATGLAQAQSYRQGYYAGCNCVVPQTRVVTTTRYLPPPVVRTRSPALLLQAVPVRGQTAVVHFDFDRSNLDANDRAILNGVAAGYTGMAQVEHVTVVGHTDSIGSQRYNVGLSQRRADSVAGYLSGQGHPHRITTVAAGESQPVASNRSRRGRAANRRAEVIVDGYALVPPKPMVRYSTHGIRHY